MTNVAEKFIEYIQYEKRYSPHTITSYKNDLAQFFAYLSAVYQLSDIKEVNHLIVRSWMVSLVEKKIDPRSINRKVTTLKSFYRFLLREGILFENPMLKIQAPKIAKKLPLFVEKDKMTLLFDHVNFGEGFSAFRDRLLMEIFYSTGVRLSELINLKEADVDLGQLSLKVLGKRNKERIIPFSHALKQHIADYLELKNKQSFKNKSLYVFVTDNGEKLYSKFVYRLTVKLLGQVTTMKKKSPHVLRHTFATHMLNNGADINAIKELLGHANLAATQVYTHNTIEKLKNIHKQSHPKA